MPTITGTILDGGGAALASHSISFTRLDGAGWSGSSVLSVDTVTTTTNGSGVFSRALTGGTWQMRWYTNEGLASDLTLGIPATGGPYDLEDVVVDPQVAHATAGIVWFADLDALLDASANTWRQARTLNVFPGDGIISGWDRVLKTDAAAASLDDNGDSIRETTDGLAYAVRTLLAPS